MEVANVVGIRGAFATFRGKVDIQIMVHNGHIEHPWIKKHLIKKHEAMNAYFEQTCTKVTVERICDIKIPEQDENYKGCIWICWWQGLKNAPDIVKKCVESIRIHAGNHKIVIITDENYKEFVTFPTWLEEKYKRGIITKTPDEAYPLPRPAPQLRQSALCQWREPEGDSGVAGGTAISAQQATFIHIWISPVRCPRRMQSSISSQKTPKYKKLSRKRKTAQNLSISSCLLCRWWGSNPHVLLAQGILSFYPHLPSGVIQ